MLGSRGHIAGNELALLRISDSEGEAMARARARAKKAWDLASLPVPVDTAPMEAKLVDALPDEPGWQFEPKWDGFRCLAFRAGDEVDLRAKSGKPLARYFPEVVAMLRELPPDPFVLDGELAIPLGDTLSFDALQMRLHPAESRIRKLSRETPAMLILFDCLMDADGTALLDQPLTIRRAALEEFFSSLQEPGGLRLSPYTRKPAEARKWLAKAGGALDGVVAKRVAGPYVSGERAMLKVKRLRSADCVVGGFRYATNSELVGSLLLGLYNDEGKLDHVGFTSTISNAERPALTKRLEKLKGGPGFTGDAPGDPSRWSTERSAEWVPLKPELVVEVRYDHVTGGRFRHGTKLLRWRPDKAPRQCTFEQMQQEARPGKLVAAIMGG
jgi:ATP-dependent DNA ligase